MTSHLPFLHFSTTMRSLLDFPWNRYYGTCRSTSRHVQQTWKPLPSEASGTGSRDVHLVQAGLECFRLSLTEGL